MTPAQRFHQWRVKLKRWQGCDHRGAKPKCEQYVGLKHCPACDTMIKVR